MFTVFYPIKEHSECDQLHTVNYMTPATAQFWDSEFDDYGVTNATLEDFEMSACRPNATMGPSYHGNEQPVVIFSPGMSVSRQLYSAIAQTVASYGYIVITIVTIGQSLYQSLRLPLPSTPAEKAFPLLIYGGSTATGTLARPPIAPRSTIWPGSPRLLR